MKGVLEEVERWRRRRQGEEEGRQGEEEEEGPTFPVRGTWYRMLPSRTRGNNFARQRKLRRRASDPDFAIIEEEVRHFAIRGVR